MLRKCSWQVNGKSILPTLLSLIKEGKHGIAVCSLQGKEVNCSEIFTPVVTDSGVCCAFNLHMDLKETQYSELIEEMQVNFKKNHRALLLCAIVMIGMKYEVLKTPNLSFRGQFCWNSRFSFSLLEICPKGHIKRCLGNFVNTITPGTPK